MADLVSVCIPTYNGEKYLQEALDSVKKQTYTNIEVIISDDQSRDNTIYICEEFKNEVAFPVYIYKHVPQGIGANWNNTLRKANGKYIKFLFQDDILTSDCIEKMVNILEINTKIKFVACKRNFIDSSENLDRESIAQWIKKFNDLQSQFSFDTSKEYNVITKDLFRKDYFLTIPNNKIGEPSAVMFETSILDKIGYFNMELKQTLDYEYWYRVLLRYDIAITSKPYVYFRLHDLQETNINATRKIDDYKYYEKFQYQKLFLHVQRKRQYYLLKKYNPLFIYLINIYRKIRFS